MIWQENGENAYCEITPAILALKEQWEKKNIIDQGLYKEYNVKRGLRDEDGRGVLTGLTRVAETNRASISPLLTAFCTIGASTAGSWSGVPPNGAGTPLRKPLTCCSSANSPTPPNWRISAVSLPPTAPCRRISSGTSS